jgi:hypothetical protein
MGGLCLISLPRAGPSAISALYTARVWFIALLSCCLDDSEWTRMCADPPFAVLDLRRLGYATTWICTDLDVRRLGLVCSRSKAAAPDMLWLGYEPSQMCCLGIRLGYDWDMCCLGIRLGYEPSRRRPTYSPGLGYSLTRLWTGSESRICAA